jgi:hypothetical protein
MQVEFEYKTLKNGSCKMMKGFLAKLFSNSNAEEASKKFAALFSVAHENLMSSKCIDDLYRVHKIILWASRDRDFQGLLYKNDLLRSAYSACLKFYNYIDFLDLDNDNTLSDRKIGLYANLILTCIQRFPNATEDSYKETVRSKYSDFIKIALK